MSDPVTCGCQNAADSASGCQIMSYSHVENDLNKSEYLNLNLE